MPIRKRTPKEKAGAKKYNAQPKQKRDRANRNKANRLAKKKGLIKKGDGNDVHHVTGNTASKKVKVIKASKNRSMTECGKQCRLDKAKGGRKSKPNTVKRK